MECSLLFSTSLPTTKLVEGQATQVAVSLKNRQSESLGMSMVILGLPAGLEPRYDQLKELVQSKTIDFFEIVGREINFYWRGLGAGAEISVSNLRLTIAH